MRMTNQVVHFELNGPNPDAAASYYGELFGWHTQAIPGDYILIDTHAGDGINGGMGKRDDPATRIYVENQDITTLLEKAESLGAKTVTPVTVMPDVVTFATFLDPQGNEIGLVQSSDQPGPGVSQGDNPPVAWFEILSGDPKAAWGFYQDLFGWEIETAETEGFVYGQIEGQDGGISGGIGGSQDGQPRVNLYARVDDLTKYLERAESLGGAATIQPMDVGQGTSIAMFADPQGTWFGLYRTS
jgi:uncharacterized protein